MLRIPPSLESVRHDDKTRFFSMIICFQKASVNNIFIFRWQEYYIGELIENVFYFEGELEFYQKTPSSKSPNIGSIAEMSTSYHSRAASICVPAS